MPLSITDATRNSNQGHPTERDCGPAVLTSSGRFAPTKTPQNGAGRTADAHEKLWGSGDLRESVLSAARVVQRDRCLDQPLLQQGFEGTLNGPAREPRHLRELALVQPVVGLEQEEQELRRGGTFDELRRADRAKRFAPQPESFAGERGHRAKGHVPQIDVRAQFADQLDLLALLRRFKDQFGPGMFREDRAHPVPLDRAVAVVYPHAATGFAALDDHLARLQRPGVPDLGDRLLQGELVMRVLLSDLDVEVEAPLLRGLRQSLDLGGGEFDDAARYLHDVASELPRLVHEVG